MSAPTDPETIWRVERTPHPTVSPPGPGSVRRVPIAPRGSDLLIDRSFSPGILPSGDGSPVDQVIVTSDALEASFEVLAERETRRGIPTVVRTVSWIDANYAGIDPPSRIRAFLREAYDLWGTEWVLLGGDVYEVPTRYVPFAEEDLPVDAYYACLDREWNEDGDGLFAEPLVGPNYPDAFNDIASAPDGAIWVAGYRGVATMGAEGPDAWDERHGLPSGLVHAVDVAPDGAVWVATEAGVARYQDDEWIAFEDPAGPGSSVLSSVVAVSASEVWCGGSAGLFHLADGNWSSWDLTDGIPTLPVNGLAVDGDVVWMATVAGAAKLEAGSISVLTAANSGLLNNWVLSVSVGPDGRVWFGHADTYFAQGGLSILDGTTWTTDDFPAWNGLSVRRMIHGPAADELWAATGKGLLHRTGTGNELLALASGLPSSDCFGLDHTVDGVGVATADGVGTGGSGAWSVYRSADLTLPASPDYDDADLYPELIVGRLPVTRPADVDAYLTKLANYQDAVLVDHVETALFLGEDLFEPGDGKELAQDALALFPPGYTATELYEVDGNQDVESVKLALDAGPGIVVNVSHGSYDAIGVGEGLELLFNKDVRATDAGGRSAFVVIYSCNSGAFDLESTAETFLLHPDGGAVALVANTREGVPPEDARINEAMFTEIFSSAHGEPARAVRDVFRVFVPADPDAYRGATWTRRTFLSRTYQGAPTLALWRSVPGTMTVSHPATVPYRRAPLTVHVEDGVSGLPVEGARVCASLGSSDYAYGYTDAAGDVTFDFRPDVLGEVDLVVTSPSHVPYEAVVPVAIGIGPNPVAAGWQPSPSREDLAAHERDVMLAVRNAGTASKAGWNGELFSEHAGVTVVQALATVPALSTGQTEWVGPFTIRLDPTVQDGELVRLRLEGTGEVAFQEPYVLYADVASLDLVGLDLDGDLLYPRVTNVGTQPTGPLTATLTAVAGLGSVIDGAGSVASVSPGGQATFSDGFEVSGPDGARFELTITDPDGRTFVRTIDREAPEPVWALAADPRPDGAFLTWESPLEDDIAGYRVETPDGKGGWFDEFGGLVRQGALAHVRFTPGSSRTYRVTPVDESGWTGDPRMIEAHAGPAEMPGWPRRVPSLVGPSPVMLGDLDGDDVPEVVLGSMWETNAVHVFRADGTEWTDGDARPDTDGVFGVTTGRVHAAPLMLDVDEDGGREIFAASLDGTVYAWRTDGPSGAPLPLAGWPIFHTDKGVRSAPVAADVDGDDQPEIVTFANDGLLRVFETDGTPVAGWPRTTGGFASGSTPAVADLNHDGLDDLVFGATDSLLYVVSGDGTDLPGWPQPVDAKVLCSPVLADVNGDDEPEIFCQTRAGRVVAFHLDGTALPGWPVFIGVYHSTPPSPAVADFDQDGVPEIVAAGKNKLWVLRSDGSNLPGFPHEFTGDVINSPIVADVDGDGALEIVIGTADRHLWAVRSGGAVAAGWPLRFHERPWSTPSVADVDGDGDLELALGADDQTVHLLDLPGLDVPGATPWPAYHGGADLTGVYDAPLLPTSPGVLPEAKPIVLTLRAAAPNPFRAGTDLAFSLPRDSVVRLDVYDVGGRRVARPVDGARFPAGTHRVAWDGRDASGAPVASGVYFLRLEAAGETRTGRVVRLR